MLATELVPSKQRSVSLLSDDSEATRSVASPARRRDDAMEDATEDGGRSRRCGCVCGGGGGGGLSGGAGAFVDRLLCVWPRVGGGAIRRR